MCLRGPSASVGVVIVSSESLISNVADAWGKKYKYVSKSLKNDNHHIKLKLLFAKHL